MISAAGGHRVKVKNEGECLQQFWILLSSLEELVNQSTSQNTISSYNDNNNNNDKFTLTACPMFNSLK